MSQLPRDPRQLARDILSGKVKLEDLAREKARQQMTGGIDPTARVPSPRPAPPPQQRPIQNVPPGPSPFPQRQPDRRPATPPPLPRQQQRPVQRPPVAQRQQPPRRPQIAPPTRIPTESMASRTAAADKRVIQEAAEARAEAVRLAPSASGRATVRTMIRNRQSLRTGILLSEILGPPKALRE